MSYSWEQSGPFQFGAWIGYSHPQCGHKRTPEMTPSPFARPTRTATERGAARLQILHLSHRRDTAPCWLADEEKLQATGERERRCTTHSSRPNKERYRSGCFLSGVPGIASDVITPSCRRDGCRDVDVNIRVILPLDYIAAHLSPNRGHWGNISGTEYLF